MKARGLLMRVAGGLLVVAALAWFAYMNSGASVDIDFGLFVVRSVSLSLVIYGAIILGMVFMLAVSLRGDMRTGKALERYDQIAADVLRNIEGDGEDVEREVAEKSSEKT